MDDVTRTAAGSIGDRVAAVSHDDRAKPNVPRAQPAPLRYRDRERYEIRGEQGRGGLGLVMRAHDRELGRDVAVKELLSRGNASELRFFREALITSRLEHPGIVPVHEAGRWSDGTPFYTMKLVGGRSFHELLAEQRNLDSRLAFLTNVIAVADAIAYAHDRGVIHRDLKPSNVMVGDFGETIVIDWGLAKVLDDKDAEGELPYRSPARNDLTGAGSVLGTPAYMAPEQYLGRADHRSDIYALGGILHYLLTGRTPHQRSAKPEYTDPHLDYDRKTPADLIAIARRALARDPANRYQTVRALAEDLKRFVRRDRVAARRYSVAARLALAFARHRSVALVIIAALAALTITLSVALVNIRGERADAVASREAAVAAREAAIVSSATAMLDRDPTRAWEILAAVPESASPALLRARIKAAGVADKRIKLPGRFDSKQIVAGGERVVIATNDRNLYVLKTATGELTQIADNLTAPVVWSATDDHVYMIRELSYLSLAMVPTDGGAIVELARLEQLPRSIQSSDAGVFWLSKGALHHAARGRPARVIHEKVASFVVFGTTLATCGWDNQMRIGSVDHGIDTVASCSTRGGWGVTPRGFFHSEPHRFHRYLDGKLETKASADSDALTRVYFSDAGLVAAIDPRGQGVVLRPQADAIEQIALSNRPDMVAAHGRLAGWAFPKGAIEVIDAVDGRHWSIQTTPGIPRCFGILSAARVMTCDLHEIRLWTLPASAPVIVATMPIDANNVAFDDKGTALLDGTDGRGFVLKADANTANAIHRHDDVSLGVAWCDGQACTAGWDGRVLCTDPYSGASRTAIELNAVIPSIAEGSGHCFTTAASRGVYDLRSTAKPLYKHRHEPFRLAASADARYVASGDWGGEVGVYDVSRGRLIALERAHERRVTSVAWMGDIVVSASADGLLRLSDTSLTALRTWRLGAPIRRLATNAQTIAVGLDDGTLWMVSANGESQQQVAVGAQVTRVAVSPDGMFVAAGTDDGDVFVLSVDGRAAAAGLGDDQISCLTFKNDREVVVCTRRGQVMRMPLDALSFQSTSGAES